MVLCLILCRIEALLMHKSVIIALYKEFDTPKVCEYG